MQSHPAQWAEAGYLAPDATLKVDIPEPVSPATRLRKRQVGSDGDGDGDDSKHRVKRPRLTRRNLALFDKMGKKKSTIPSSTDDSSATRTTSTTTSGFAIQASRNGMVPPRSSKPPTNLKDIRARYASSRATASPPESQFNHYVTRVESASNEAAMVFEVGSKLLKDYEDEGYKRTFNQQFNGFPKDVGFNNGLSAPQPDFAEGLEMNKFRPFPIDQHVEGAVLCKDDPYSLTLPHLAGEWKGCGKDMKRAELQSGYDGAALLYARNQALSFVGTSDPPGHSEVTTFTTDGTNLNLYAHYAAPDEDGTLEYHQYQFATENVKDSHQGHKDGRRGLRNQQDHAKKQAYALRDQLKAHWKQRSGPYPAGEDGAETVEPCQPTPDASLPAENDDGPGSGDFGWKASSMSNAQLLNPEAAEPHQYKDSGLNELVDRGEYGAGGYSHDPADAVEPSMNYAASVTSNFSAPTHQAGSKRNRASHSPPSNAHPQEKHDSARVRTRHGAPPRSARFSAQASGDPFYSSTFIYIVYNWAQGQCLPKRIGELYDCVDTPSLGSSISSRNSFREPGNRQDPESPPHPRHPSRHVDHPSLPVTPGRRRHRPLGRSRSRSHYPCPPPLA